MRFRDILLGERNDVDARARQEGVYVRFPERPTPRFGDDRCFQNINCRDQPARVECNGSGECRCFRLLLSDAVRAETENLFLAAIVEEREATPVTTDLEKLLRQRFGPAARPDPLQPFAQRPNDRLGETFAGTRGELAGKPIGFRILQAQRHF